MACAGRRGGPRRRRGRAALSACACGLAAAAAGGLAAATGGGGGGGGGARARAAAVPGVFVSVSGFMEEEVAALAVLGAPGGAHAIPSSPLYLGALALRETANCSSLASPSDAGACELFEAEIEAYEKFFPRFERVWLGVAGGPNAPDNGNCESWLDPVWVAGLVARVRGAAELVSRRFGGKRGRREAAQMGPELGWYFSHEGFIEHLHEGCRAQNGSFVAASEFLPAFSKGMSAAVGELRRLEPSWPIMWSPAAREGAGHSLDQIAFAAAAAKFHAAVGLDEIHLQDSVGKASSLMPNGTVQYMTGCEHAAALVEALETLGSDGPIAAVNMELFVRTRPHFGPGKHGTVVGDPREHEARRACYLSRRIPQGVSWEALWYYRSFYEPVSWVGAPSVGPGADPICRLPPPWGTKRPEVSLMLEESYHSD